MKLSDYTKPEIRYFIRECNFTETELMYFNLAVTGMTLEEIAEEMSLSVSMTSKYSKKVREKITRLVELDGNNSRLSRDLIPAII